MKFSIITVCYNSERYLASAMESVLSQTYPDIEYLVIDGNSKDRSVDIIKSFEPRFSGRLQFISEKDDGIYDAMNKGLARATGDVVGFLNSDDVFENREVIQHYADVFSSQDVAAVFADLTYVRPEDLNSIVRRWRSGCLPKSRMLWGWHPAHPTFYVKREIYSRFGTFDTRFRIAADYELMLRFIQKYKISCAYLDRRTVRMRLGGASNASFRNIVKANRESTRSWEYNNLSANPLTIPLKIMRKLAQFSI